MSAANLTLLLRFYGISPWELEVLYSLLHGIFNVVEYPNAEQDEDFTTMIDITFPIEFNEAFFKWFGIERWNKLMDIIKEMKRRRGRANSLRTYIKFTGKPSITFMVDLADRRSFDTAIDKINFVLELLPYHLDPQKMPKEILQILYLFDEKVDRWNIKSGTGVNEIYLFSKNEWKIT